VEDGTTVLVVLQLGAHLLAANVGDSPAYLCPRTRDPHTTPTLLTQCVVAPTVHCDSPAHLMYPRISPA
jgi:hypothetical protein